MGERFQIPRSRQGQTGKGQGGWGCWAFASRIDAPVTVALRNPIPLEADLEIVQHDEDRWLLVPADDPALTLLEATRWVPDHALTSPVSLDQAQTARVGFPLAAEDHPAPQCASCGLGPRSLRAHAGPLGDGRWATPFRLPDWAVTPAGAADESLLWMAMDCSCGWYTSMEGPEYRRGVTVQFAVDVHQPIEAETDYALVAWSGDYAPMWEGRKRGAAAALFAADGTCVAQSRSFWLSLDV